MRLWRHLILGLVTSFGIFLALASVDARGSGQGIGSVRFIFHGLTVQPSHQRATQAKVKQRLFSLDRLLTGADQKASLGFLDRSVLDMNQRTDLVLHSPRLIVIRRGEAAAFVVAGTHRRIQTATAIAAAVGTEFDVRITPAPARSPYPASITETSGPILPPGTTTVSVVKGTVIVSNRFGSVSVLPGHWTHVPPGKPPSTPTPHNARADIRWTNVLPPP